MLTSIHNTRIRSIGRWHQQVTKTTKQWRDEFDLYTHTNSFLALRLISWWPGQDDLAWELCATQRPEHKDFQLGKATNSVDSRCVPDCLWGNCANKVHLYWVSACQMLGNCYWHRKLWTPLLALFCSRALVTCPNSKVNREGQNPHPICFEIWHHLVSFEFYIFCSKLKGQSKLHLGARQGERDEVERGVICHGGGPQTLVEVHISSVKSIS